MAYRAFDTDLHLPVVVGILASLYWGNFRHDPELTRRSLTAPGATAIVAVALETGGSPRSSQTSSSRRTSTCWRWTRGGTAGVSAGGSWRKRSRG